MLPFALRAHHHHMGVEGMWLAEVTALASILHPRLFQRSEMSVDVETHGHLTRGMTVFDRRPQALARRNIEVLTDVDSQGVLDYLSSITGRAVGG
jgi:purine nucleosidase